MINEIIALSVGILIGFGMGFYMVYAFCKEKLLIQEVAFTKDNIKILEENKKLLEENVLLVKALNNKTPDFDSKS